MLLDQADPVAIARDNVEDGTFMAIICANRGILLNQNEKIKIGKFSCIHTGVQGPELRAEV
jgi:hypothetical protein